MTLLLRARFLGLVRAAIAYPFGAVLAVAILGPIGAPFVMPYLRFRHRSPHAAPERHAILDLLNHLNPFF